MNVEGSYASMNICWTSRHLITEYKNFYSKKFCTGCL
jgi:hypothetical protein